MKQLFTLTLSFIAFFTITHAQLSVGMHSGLSNKNMIAGLHSQYQFKNRFTAGFNMTTHTDNSNPAFFQSRLGFTFGNPGSGFSVQPYAGYNYWLQNIEQKNYGSSSTAGIQLRYQFNDIGLVYSDLNFCSNYHIISIGIAGKLPGRNE
jgi:hypothetical protein